MVSQIQQPSLLISTNSYQLVDDIPKNVTNLYFNIQIKTIQKSNNYVDNRRTLTQLANLYSQIQQKIPLISIPIAHDLIQPYQIKDLVIKNIKSLQKHEKKIKEIMKKMKQSNLQFLTVKKINTIFMLQTLSISINQTLKKDILFSQSILFVYQYVFNQRYILSQISIIQQYIKHNIQSNQNLISNIQDNKQFEYQIRGYVGITWIIIDFLSYILISYNRALSKSYAVFFHIWIIIQIVYYSIASAVALGPLYAFALFASIMLILWALFYRIQKNFNENSHKGRYFDLSICTLFKNMLILGIMANIVLHILYYKQSNIYILLMWSLKQLMSILYQYYYLLTVLPQIILTFKIKKTQKLSLLRVAVLLVVGYSNNYLMPLANQYQLILLFKQEILALLLLLQAIIYRNSPKIQLLSQQNESTQLLAKS